MKKAILLAGPSAAGKTTLSRALCRGDRRFHVSTSAYLKATSGARTSGDLFQAGATLDRVNPNWLHSLVFRDMRNTPAAVDAVRSFEQHNSFGDDSEVVRINVVADHADLSERHRERDTQPLHTPFQFNRPDFVWNSSRMSLNTAVAAVEQLGGGGVVDAVIGGQYGSEGKGKLCALLAPHYEALVRSGGPNAGHWVREESWEYCFHHLPSGIRSNPLARIYLAAGASFYPPRLAEEIEECHASGRITVDGNAVAITDADRAQESDLIGMVGSTSQGVGRAQARRVMRGGLGPVAGVLSDTIRGRVVPKLLAHLQMGHRVMLEGTQGSALSLYHGPYPFCTSRDTNVQGLLSEVGMAPTWLRDTWMVIRTFPIRVGGNSGPMFQEIGWEQVAARAGLDPAALQKQELTSTTKRQRRVGEFDFHQFERAVDMNRPTRLFLSFADYLTPAARGVRDWAKLPEEVRAFCDKLESESGCPVGGVSTGRSQTDVVLRKGFIRD